MASEQQSDPSIKNNDTTEPLGDDKGDSNASQAVQDAPSLEVETEARKSRPTSARGALNKLGLTRKEITDLKILHKENLSQWREEVSLIMRNKDEVFRVMDFGDATSGDHDDITEDEFKLHFKNTFDDEMIGWIWKDLKKTKSGGVTVMTVHRWINKIRRSTVSPRAEEPHNEKWLYTKLKNLTFIEVDDARVGYLTKDAFFSHFRKEGVSDATATKVFNQIDNDRNGTISVKEFITWQHNFTRTEFKSMHQVCIMR